MIYNCVTSLKHIEGESDNKTQGQAQNDIRGYLTASSNEVLNFYNNLPVGQTFSFLFCDDSISVHPETEITVTDAFSSELTVGEVYIVVGVPKKAKIGGQIIYSGVCVRKEA